MKTQKKTIYGISFVVLAALTIFAMSNFVVAHEPNMVGIINPSGGITNNCDRVAQGYCDDVAEEVVDFTTVFFEAIIDGTMADRGDEFFDHDDSDVMVSTPDPANPGQKIVQTYYGFDETVEAAQGFSIFNTTGMEFDTRYIHVIDDNSASQLSDSKTHFITLVDLPGVPVGTHGTNHATQSNTFEKKSGEWKMESTIVHVLTTFDL